MKTVPRFLKDPCGIVLRTALGDINVEDVGRQATKVEILPALSRVVLPSCPERRHHRQAEVVGSSNRVRGWISLKRVGRSPKKRLKLVGARITELRMISRRRSAELKLWERCRQPDKLSKEHLSRLVPKPL